VCDLETSRTGAPYIYDISRLRVNLAGENIRRTEKDTAAFLVASKETV